MTTTLLPPGVKFGAPATSLAAAEAVAGRSQTLRCAVLAWLQGRAGTADECAAALGESVLAIRPRFSELRRDGIITDTGERRFNDSGLKAVVRRVLPGAPLKQGDLL